MPELPEVQTVVNGIKSKLIGLKIKDTEVFVKKLRYPVPPKLNNKINKSLLSKIFGTFLIIVSIRSFYEYLIIN